jgi:hypothetical protein
VCAETIKAAAAKCRFCDSDLAAIESAREAEVEQGVPDLERLADTLRECSLKERARRRVTTFVEA